MTKPTMKIEGLSLTTKMIIGNVFLVLLMVLPLGYMDINERTKIIKEDTEKLKQVRISSMQKVGISNVQNVSLACLTAIANHDYKFLRDIIRPIVKSDKEIAFGLVMDEYMQVLAHSDSTQEFKIFDDPAGIFANKQMSITTNQYSIGNESILEIIAPITYNGRKWGTVRFGYTLKYLNEELKSAEQRREKAIRSSLIRTISVGLLFIVIGSLIAVFQSVRIARPIKTLSAKAELISQGDLSQKVRVESKDEIGLLSKTFNEMADSLSTMYDVSRTISSTADLKKVLNNVIESIKSVVPYRTCAIFLLENDELVISVGSGFPREIEKDVRLKIGEGITGLAVQNKEPVVVPDIDKEPQYKIKPVPEVKSAVAIPLMIEERVVGALTLDSTNINGFSNRDVNLLSHLAEQIAVAIDNARLQKELYEKERMKKEMEIANKIQTTLLPPIPNIPGYDISAHMIPAEEVGGDYYDTFYSNDGRNWFGIGDVSGHGLTSGLIMMMTQSMVNAIVKKSPQISPKEMIVSLNKALYENIRSRLKIKEHMTLSLLAHNNNGTFTLAGAHEDIIIYRAERKECEKITTPGVWVGIMPDIEYCTEEIEIKMNKGDIMLLYTDGLIQAKNNKGEQFDIPRLISSVNKNANLSAEDIKTAILDDVLHFMNKQDDDITLMVIKKIS